MILPDDLFSFQDFPHPSLWRNDVPIWDPLPYLETYLKNYPFRIEIEIPQGVHLKNKHLISIGEGTQIDPGVFIVGPCIIGKHCSIRHGAFLREGVILGDHCVVGHTSELKNSVLMNGAMAAHFCYVGDSIVGPRVNLAAGVKCANVRLDKREVCVDFRGEKINTGLKKFGAILGEDVQVGCNCVLNPGTIVGKKSLIYPLLNIGGTIPPHSQVRSAQKWIVESRQKKILESLMHRT